MSESAAERWGLAESRAPYRVGGMIPIYVATPGAEVDVVCLGSHVLGVEMHWDGSRTRPCVAKSGYCAYCESSGPPDRWKGFVVAFDYRRGRYCLAEMTSDAFNSCPELGSLAGKLRGHRLRLRRAGTSRNSRLVAIVDKVSIKGTELPKAFDGFAELARIWNLEETRQGRTRPEDRDPETEGL